MAVEFAVLGPLVVNRDGVPVTSRSVILTRLLALLLCRAGQTVSMADLTRGLWGVDPPVHARKSLHVCVHRLRRMLGDGRVRSEPGGYRLVVEPSEVDALVFGDLYERGRLARQRADLDDASALLGSALSLWRGTPYADVYAGPLVVDEVRRLTEQRLLVWEAYAGVELDLGRHAELVGELARLTDAHPYRESLRGHYMLALYRAGRQIEALEAFRRTRAMLVEEFGVEPGVVLRRLHEAILRGDDRLNRLPADDVFAVLEDGGPAVSRTAPGPHRGVAATALPPQITGFTGRDAELSRLDAVLGAETVARSSAVTTVLINGPAGIGKTALAVHWARRVEGRFPDGQIFVDLREPRSGKPISSREALAACLRALGVAADRLPVRLDEAAGLYRSLVAGKRLLVLLDGAVNSEQVRPLIPGGAGSVVVVTSRTGLDGLVALDGARRLPLDG